MRLVLAHNLRLSTNEDEAEFDSPATIEAIVTALRELGHDVEPLEVTGTTARLAARLEALGPELVVNLAAGRRGRYREAFFPALFDELGLPHTGSDAHACAVCLDKAMTKLVAERLGVPTPRGVLVDARRTFVDPGLTFPVLVKPNFEGSSKGVHASSIVARPDDLAEAIERALRSFPQGVLVEELFTGRDVSVPWLEGAKGALGPVEVFATRPSPSAILDFEAASSGLGIEASPHLEPRVRGLLADATAKLVRALDVRDHAVLDFRVDDADNVRFLEANTLPGMGETSILRAAARGVGLDTLSATFERVLASACARYGLSPKVGPRTKKRPVRVGLTYNEKRIKPGQGGENDAEAEFDSPATIDAIAKAIASHGHEVVKLEATPELASTLGPDDVDVVFNVAEGLRGRNRESQVPALLELLDIPYTGSDPATLALALDKGLAKRVVGQAGIPTPRWTVLVTGRERLPKDLTFPVVVKPVAEGSSKGVLGKSVAYTEDEAREHAQAILTRYKQGALVEEFLPGREFTVALLGYPKPRVLAPMEIVFREDLKDPIYTFDHKLDANDEVRYEAPAKLEPKLLREIERVALGAFTTLGCRDVARIDLRLDAAGRPSFIECNPLPGLTPGWSDICLIANAVGLGYEALIGEILAPALRRSRKHGPRSAERAST
ncbi:MAG: hypothetical protein U0183_14465 [Polyangiaceae bacterium]